MNEDKDKTTIDDVINQTVEGEEPEPQQDPDPKDEPTPEPKPTDGDDPKPTDGDDPKPTDGDDPEPDKDDKSKKTEDSSVIRNLRKQQKESSQQVKQYDQMLEKLAKQKGISKDELVEELQTEADQKDAKEKNISPEIQKQLREQQEALDSLKQERQREVFNTKFDKLSEEYPMENEEARDFVQNAIDAGIDLGNPNTDFKAVYIALNHESIMDKVREEERQKTLQRIEEQRKKSPSVTKQRNQSDDAKKGGINDALADILGT